MKGREGQLLEARQSCGKNSALRNMAVIKCEYYNVPLIDYKVNEHGEEVEDRKEPEVVFTLQDFLPKLEHDGALYLKYLRFREKV